MNDRTSICRPLMLAFLIALPFGFVVGFLAMGVYEGWREYKREVLELDTWAKYQHRALGFLADGTPVVRDNRSVARGQSYDQYARLDGTPIESHERDDILHPQRLRYAQSRRRHPFDKAPFEDLLLRRNRWQGFRDPANRAIQWTWESANGSNSERILIARYRHDASVVWLVTPDGFLPGSTPRSDGVKGFDHPEHWLQYEEMVSFLSDGKLMAVDLADQTVSTITSLDAARQSWMMFKQNDETGWRFVVQSSDVLTVYTEQGNELFAYPFDMPGDRRPNFYTPTIGGFIVTRVESYNQESLSGGARLYQTDQVATWLSDTGEVTRTMKFQDEYRSEVAESSSAVVDSIDWFMESIGPGLVAPEPAVICGAFFVVVPWVSQSMDPQKSASEVIADVLEELPYAIPVSAIVAICCAVACWRRQTRYQADWTRTWTVFVLLFGLPAWIAWRVHRRWPPLEIAAIPDGEFVEPELNGLEIR